jgi:hypothetical protein
MKRPECRANFAADWYKWYMAINEYSLATNNPSTSLRRALNDYPADDDPADGDHAMGDPHGYQCS